jgi:hypothetical protein
MDIYFWLEMTGALTALLLLLLIARLLTGQLILPAKAYVFLSSAGLTAYIVFLVAPGGHASFPMGGLAAVWVQWLVIAPKLLPLVSGLLGWVALRSFWRWCFLAVGIGLLLLPYVVALVLYWLGGGHASG